MNGLLLAIGLSGAAAVGAGAFGAHGASGEAAGWLKTGAEYQLLHLAAALAVMGALPGGRAPAVLFLAGGWIFGGSLYLMALGAPRWFGAITPVGGLAFIAGWLLLAWRAARGV